MGRSFATAVASLLVGVGWVKAACPEQCAAAVCKAGSADNGGKPVDGTHCHYHCSKHYGADRYCGEGPDYKEGDFHDCTGCKPGETVAAAPAPATGAPAGPAQPEGTAWPACQDQNAVVRNAGEALFENLQGYGATIGCFLDDCMSTDKFVAVEIESCAKVCFSLPECKFWVWGTEEGEQKCWFRTGDAGREAGEGWISGRKSCHPPGTQKLVMGNDECWAEGFGYPECCDAKYGPNGNAQCWDGVYNYDRCCFPKEEL